MSDNVLTIDFLKKYGFTDTRQCPEGYFSYEKETAFEHVMVRFHGTYPENVMCFCKTQPDNYITVKKWIESKPEHTLTEYDFMSICKQTVGLEFLRRTIGK